MLQDFCRLREKASIRSWHSCKDLAIGHIQGQDTGQGALGLGVIPSVCLVCLRHVLWLASVFRSVVRKKLSPPLRLQSTLVMCFWIVLGTYHLMWWASPLMKLCWAPFLHQERDIGNASALSCCLHLPCESYGFWSFLLGVKFMRGFWEVLCFLWWTGACRKNVWEPEKYIYCNISCWLQRTRLSGHVRVQQSQRGLCPSFLDFSHTCPDSGFAHTCFVSACTTRQLQLSYCCAVMDLRIISEHRHILSSSDSTEAFKPGCGQFLSWGSGRQGMRWWKESTGILWKLNSLPLKFSTVIPICSSEGSSAHSQTWSYHLLSYCNCGFRVGLSL